MTATEITNALKSLILWGVMGLFISFGCWVLEKYDLSFIFLVLALFFFLLWGIMRVSGGVEIEREKILRLIEEKEPNEFQVRKGIEKYYNVTSTEFSEGILEIIERVKFKRESFAKGLGLYYVGLLFDIVYSDGRKNPQENFFLAGKMYAEEGGFIFRTISTSENILKEEFISEFMEAIKLTDPLVYHKFYSHDKIEDVQGREGIVQEVEEKRGD